MNLKEINKLPFYYKIKVPRPGMRLGIAPSSHSVCEVGWLVPIFFKYFDDSIGGSLAYCYPGRIGGRKELIIQHESIYLYTLKRLTLYLEYNFSIIVLS